MRQMRAPPIHAHAHAHGQLVRCPERTAVHGAPPRQAFPWHPPTCQRRCQLALGALRLAQQLCQVSGGQLALTAQGVLQATHSAGSLGCGAPHVLHATRADRAVSRGVTVWLSASTAEQPARAPEAADNPCPPTAWQPTVTVSQPASQPPKQLRSARHIPAIRAAATPWLANPGTPLLAAAGPAASLHAHLAGLLLCFAPRQHAHQPLGLLRQLMLHRLRLRSGGYKAQEGEEGGRAAGRWGVHQKAAPASQPGRQVLQRCSGARLPRALTLASRMALVRRAWWGSRLGCLHAPAHSKQPRFQRPPAGVTATACRSSACVEARLRALAVARPSCWLDAFSSRSRCST